MVRKPLESVIKDFIGIHGNKYDYSLVEYITNKVPVTIICSVHGEFKQKPNSHLLGKGCKKCGDIEGSKKRMHSKEEFVEKANKKHNYKYNYEHTNYTGDGKKLEVECKVHGSFTLRANSHLNGVGCKKCYESVRSCFSRTGFEEKAKGKDCQLYLIKCWNENEEFYKIGITTKDPKHRFSSSIAMPYNYEIIDTIIGTATYIFDLEKNTLRDLSPYKYVPNIKFVGHTECVKKENLNLQFLK